MEATPEMAITVDGLDGQADHTPSEAQPQVAKTNACQDATPSTASFPSSIDMSMGSPTWLESFGFSGEVDLSSLVGTQAFITTGKSPEYHGSDFDGLFGQPDGGESTFNWNI